MQTNQPSEWTGKKVFITGGTGFLGTHLSHKLHSLGAQVSLFVHRQDSVLPVLKIYGDLRYGVSTLPHFLEEREIEVVFHLASQALVSEAMKDEVSTLETNIGGTHRVLNACRKVPSLKKFIHISTDKVYGDTNPIEKTSLLNGIKHPYNASKHASDILAQMYMEFFNVPTVIIRNANVYGSGDKHFDRIVPRTIYKALKGERPVIRGDGRNTRDYIHVDDLIDGYLRAALLPNNAILNFGGYNHSTLEVIDCVLEKMGRVDLAPVFEKQWKGEIPHQHIINDLAKELIEWNPKINLSDGLDKTIPWYVEQLRG